MRADRLLSLMLHLHSKGKTTTSKLAELLEVSRRTILRDINALTEAGVPIYTESGHHGGVYLDEKYQISLTGLNLDEIRSLFVSSLPDILKDIGLDSASESSYLKLMAALPSNQKTEIERLQQRIYIDPLEWKHHSHSIQFLNELLAAVFQDTRLKVIYKRADSSIVKRTLEPCSLVAKATVWYLIAAYNGQFHTYRVSRFQAIEPLEEGFERVSNFDLRKYMAEQVERRHLQAPYYTCTLEIKSERIETFNWSLIEDLKVVKASDRTGWQIIEIKFGFIETIEMLLIALGQDALLLEPADLINRVIARAKNIVEMYVGLQIQ